MPRYGQWALAGVIAIAVFWLFRTHLRDLAAVLWPSLVAGAVYGFRTELRDLLRRIRRVSKEGAEFGEIGVAAQIMAQPVDVALREVAPDETHPTYIRQQVDALRIELNARVPEDATRREYLLMLRLAEAQRRAIFLEAWLRIFESQLDSLGKSVAEPNGADLRPFFDSHVTKIAAASTPENPITPLSYEMWVHFLVQRQLITLSAGDLAVITEQGRDFLTVANQFNLPRFQIF